jgi:hypothetical protein
MSYKLRNALVRCRAIGGWIGGRPKPTTRTDRYKLTLWTRSDLPYAEYPLSWPQYREAVAFWEALGDRLIARRKLYTYRKAA